MSSAALTSFPVIDGTPLEVVWHGPPPDAATTLVFLHEGLGSAAIWRDFPRLLAAETGCAALVSSRRGYGSSGPATLPRPTRYLHHEAQVVLPELLRTLNVQQHVLIGHSDGGSIALIYAAQPQIGLKGAITEAAHVFKEQLSHDGILEAREAYQSGDLRRRLSRYHQDVDNAFWGWNDVWLSEEFWHWNLEQFLPSIRVPLLVIQGEQDQYGTVRQVQAIVDGAGGPADPLILPDCAHIPHREAAEATFQAMSRFIRQVTRT